MRCNAAFFFCHSQKSGFTTLTTRVSKELEVKRSKFVATASHIDCEQSAFTFLAEVSDPRATHNCWAYKLRDKYRFSDDGEPGGTAGRPIYGAIQNCGLDEVMVVVTRYFGGTKLGTGGLVRAYGGVASDCLRDAPTCIVKAKVKLKLRIGFNFLGAVYSLLERYGVQKEERFFEDENGGGVEMHLVVDKDKEENLESDINNACRGNANILKDASTTENA